MTYFSSVSFSLSSFCALILLIGQKERHCFAKLTFTTIPESLLLEIGLTRETLERSAI